MHNFYLTRTMEFYLFTRVNKLCRKPSVGNNRIYLVAVDLMAIDTMAEADKLDMATREDAAFLFSLIGFTDIDAASQFMDDFMEKVNG